MSKDSSLESLRTPPDANAYIVLPDEFGRRFALFVDTEEDFDWSRPFSRTGHSTRSMSAIADFQARMDSAGVKPVYLVDHAVASAADPASLLRGFQDAGTCTIGAHLHPWINPPHEEPLSGPNSFAGNLPPELERAKLAVLTETIERAFGRRPTLFRAGRYGVGSDTARFLVELGYTIDTSIRARFDYSAEKGPDFTDYRPIPYTLLGGRLLEIPLSAVYLGRFPGSTRMQRQLARIGLAKRAALTPEGTSLGDAKAAVDALLAEDVRLFSLSFHSPSLVPGNTPFVRSQSDLDGFHGWWEGMLDHLAKRGIAPASIDEIAAAARPA